MELNNINIYIREIIEKIEDNFLKNHLYFSDVTGFNICADFKENGFSNKNYIGYFGFGKYGLRNEDVNTEFVLKKLKKLSNSNSLASENLYRPKMKDILNASILENKFELNNIDIDNENKNKLYVCRYSQFNIEKKELNKTSYVSTIAMDFYDLFIDVISNFYSDNQSGVNKVKNEIGIIEIEIKSEMDKRKILKVFETYFGDCKFAKNLRVTELEKAFKSFKW